MCWLKDFFFFNRCNLLISLSVAIIMTSLVRFLRLLCLLLLLLVILVVHLLMQAMHLMLLILHFLRYLLLLRLGILFLSCAAVIDHLLLLL